MLIDWFTVVAQVFNFLLLVWLLKHFLYKPILDAIDAREQRIAEALADADERKIAAQRERDEFARKNLRFIEQREAMISQAKDEMDVTRQKLLDDAHQAADAVSVRRYEALQREQKKLGDEIARRTQEQVFFITRKTLQDLADTRLEESIASVFTRKLRELNGNEKQAVAEALTTSAEPVCVRSAFELPGEQQATIRQALNQTFSANIPVRFETAPNDIGGIELTCNGQKVAWSIDEYLNLLQKSITELTESDRKAKGGETELESESPG